MKNTRSRLRNNLSPVRIYAIAALICMLLFQSYWLHAVFVRQRGQLLRTAENVLRTNVLYQDVNAMITITDETATADPVQDSVVDAQGEKPSGMIKIYIEDSILPDSLLEQITQLSQQPSEKPEASLENLYGKIRDELTSAYPGLQFKLVRSKKGEISSYPENTLSAGSTSTKMIFSQSQPDNAYQLSFPAINAAVWVDIIPSIVLSVLYLVVCVSAVILLIYSHQKAKKLMQLKDDFTHNMTHEFKTPIATLYAATEALGKYNQIDDKETAREYIGLMQGDLERLSAMTDAILNHAKLTDGKMILHRETILLEPLLRQLEQQFKLQFEKSGARIDLSRIPADIQIEGDLYHLSAVFSNLIDNALKYTKNPAEISVSAEKTGEKVRILFSDRGTGIPEKHKNQVFEPYFRISEGDRHEVKGYGLGLSYVREMINLHRGTISLVYDHPGTTTFEITLPLLTHA